MSRDTCKACGHARVFHQIGRGAGVPAGLSYCDDRYSAPCACSAFVEESVPIEKAVPDKIQTVLSPELDLALYRDKIQTVLSPELDLALCRELVSRARMGEKLGSARLVGQLAEQLEAALSEIARKQGLARLAVERSVDVAHGEAVDDSTVEDARQAQTTILLQRSVAVEHHNVQLAEQRINRRWGRATLVAVLLTLIPNFPAWSAVLVPSALVAIYEGLLVWRKRQRASNVTRISARLTLTHHDVSEDLYSLDSEGKP